MTHKHDQLTVCEGEHPIQVEAHAVSWIQGEWK
jgi:hypothetical protein